MQVVGPQRGLQQYGIRSVSQLHEVARHGRQNELQLLLEYPYSMNPDVTNGQGRTALMCAAQGNQQHCANALIDNGANVNFCDEDGTTSIHCAALCGHTAMVLLLIRRGASMDALTHKTRSPFELAIAGGHAEAARILAASGCSIKTGVSQWQDYRKQAMFMDRQIRWLKTKQVLALLDLLQKTPRQNWHEACRVDWPVLNASLSLKQAEEEDDEAAEDHRLATVMAAKKATTHLKGLIVEKATFRADDSEATARLEARIQQMEQEIEDELGFPLTEKGHGFQSPRANLDASLDTSLNPRDWSPRDSSSGRVEVNQNDRD